MSPVERLQAAIDTLTQLKAESKPGPWVHEVDVIHGTTNGAVYTRDEFDGDRLLVGDWIESAEGELLITLHRTIDAQIAILRETLFQLEGAPTRAGFIGNEFSLIMRLADAILGVPAASLSGEVTA